MVLKSVNITLNIMDKKIMVEALASELQEIKGGSAGAAQDCHCQSGAFQYPPEIPESPEEEPDNSGLRHC